MRTQGHTETLPLVPETHRQAAMATDRSAVRPTPPDVPEFDKAEIGRDAFAYYSHGGAIAVASAWLVIYVIAALYGYIAWSLSFVPWVR